MNSLFTYLHRKSRQKKFQLFLQLLRPLPEARILNVGAIGTAIGVTEQLENFYPYHECIVGGGLSLGDVKDYRRSFPRVQAAVFDGCGLPFADKSFDIIYSNAVIEHLPGWEAQRQFAEEVRRVGRAWFVTTPNYWYPVEPHYHLPLLQFLPADRQRRLVRALGKTPYPAFLLLSAGQMRRLFPESRVVGCRVTFYPETLIAVGPAARLV